MPWPTAHRSTADHNAGESFEEEHHPSYPRGVRQALRYEDRPADKELKPIAMTGRVRIRRRAVSALGESGVTVRGCRHRVNPWRRVCGSHRARHERTMLPNRRAVSYTHLTLPTNREV